VNIKFGDRTALRSPEDCQRRDCFPSADTWVVLPYRNGERGRPSPYREAMPHISDDSLEQYAMQTLPEPDVNLVEQHLLICEICQDRFRVTDAYVAAMRSALKRHETREDKVFSSSRFRLVTTAKQ
jgi:hypothetical protein